jgi:hypothetical protein
MLLKVLAEERVHWEDSLVGGVKPLSAFWRSAAAELAGLRGYMYICVQ